MEIVLSLVLIIIFTKIAGQICIRLGQPSVLGKLIAGIILGPAILNWVQPSEFIDHISELGVLLLMFIAGLETNLDELKRNWKSALAVAVGGVILPVIGGYSIGMVIGLTNAQSIFLGLLVSATSVSISVQTLKELDQLDSREGTTILGAAVVDDVLVVILLAVVMSLLGGGEQVSIPLLIGKEVLFFAIIILASIWVVPFVMKLFSKFQVTETIASAAVLICLAFAYVAEWLGVAGIIGAFAAGIAIGQTSYKHTVDQKIEPIAYTIFVPVFFVSIGLNISFEGLGSQWLFIVAFSIICILSKLIGGGLGAKLTGLNLSSSIIVGMGMISRGEVALIIASTGLASGLLAQEYFTAVILVVIVTTLVTPPLLKWSVLRREKHVVSSSGSASEV